jgi:2-polyprenyl-3-methyl-5-hydroxy-6-metoxy-1,4-benzoquinol methylase
MSETNERDARIEHELAHGRYLATHNAEEIWGWTTPAGQVRADRRAHMIVDAAGLKPGMRVVEVGCGTGLFTERLAKSGADITAVDISPDLLALARQRQNLDANRIRFVEGKFEEIELPEKYDAVIGSSVLHHLEVEAALRKVHALLKPGGAMAFAEPNMLNPQIAVQKNVPVVKRWAGDSPDETAFIRWPMRRMLTRLGFVDIHITPFDWLHPATPRALMSAVSGMGRFFEHVPVVREFAGSLVIAARVA